MVEGLEAVVFHTPPLDVFEFATSLFFLHAPCAMHGSSLPICSPRCLLPPSLRQLIHCMVLNGQVARQARIALVIVVVVAVAVVILLLLPFGSPRSAVLPGYCLFVRPSCSDSIR